MIYLNDQIYHTTRMDTKKNLLNVYDFDKTIYDGDSSIDFYIFALSRSFLLILKTPITFVNFFLYKFKIITKLEFKQRYFSFLKNIKNVDGLIDKFWDKNIKKIKKWYFEDKCENKVIISASPEFLLNHIKGKLNAGIIIGSKINKNTGKFEGKNCYGEEKLERFKEIFGNCEIDNFYSDSISDVYLANISNNSFLVKGNKLRKWC